VGVSVPILVGVKVGMVGPDVDVGVKVGMVGPDVEVGVKVGMVGSWAPATGAHWPWQACRPHAH
jgi:hypothetical protein